MYFIYFFNAFPGLLRGFCGRCFFILSAFVCVYNNAIMTSNSASQKVEKMGKMMFGDANAADERDQAGILEYVSNFYDNTDRCIFINKGQKEVVLKDELKVRTTGVSFSTQMVEDENYAKDQPLSPSEIESLVKHAGSAGFTMEDYLKWVGFNTENIEGCEQ